MEEKNKKYGRKLTFFTKEYYIFSESSILQLMICSFLRFWIFMSIRGEEIYLLLLFPSSVHLSLGRYSNFKVSNFGKISTFPSIPWRTITCSRTSQYATFIFFKFWKLFIKEDGIRLSRHEQWYTFRPCKLQKDPNGSWWCHISFNLGRPSSSNSSKLGNKTCDIIHYIINWKVMININIFLKSNSSTWDYSHIYFNYILKNKMIKNSHATNYFYSYK